MLLLRTDALPSGEQWLYELKLDGDRAIAFRRNGTVLCDRATTTTSTRDIRRLWTRRDDGLRAP
jgi:hypothetical protein